MHARKRWCMHGEMVLYGCMDEYSMHACEEAACMLAWMCKACMHEKEVLHGCECMGRKCCMHAWMCKACMHVRKVHWDSVPYSPTPTLINPLPLILTAPSCLGATC